MYIPESYIIETGYDQGGNFVVASSNQPYKGYYHKDKANRYWTGEKHTDSSLLLNRITADSNINVDTLLKQNETSAGFTRHFSDKLDTPLISGDFIRPTTEDYTRGYFNRYFAQLKTSVNLYIVEINKDNFDALLKNKRSEEHTSELQSH